MLHKNSINQFFNFNYLKENDSYVSTNKDSNIISSIKGTNYYNLFRKKNNLKNKKNDFEEEKNEKSKIFGIHDYIYKNKKKTNHKNYTTARNDYYPNNSSKFNNFYKSNYTKDSIINRTMRVLSLQKGNMNSDISMFDTNRCFLINYYNRRKIKNLKKKKLNENFNKTQLLKENKKIFDENKVLKKNNNNNTAKSDFKNEQKKLELIKKQYIKNIKKSQILFHDVKEKMNNITLYQNNILSINNKTLKYSNLSQEDNLKKYKEENNKYLKDFKSKNNHTKKRPLSCGNNKLDNNNMKKLRKKILNSQLISGKEKRENDLNSKIDRIINYNNIKNKCFNRLRFYNAILDANNDKKIIFYNNYLKQKFKNNNVFKKRYYCNNISC